MKLGYHSPVFEIYGNAFISTLLLLKISPSRGCLLGDIVPYSILYPAGRRKHCGASNSKQGTLLTIKMIMILHPDHFD